MSLQPALRAREKTWSNPLRDYFIISQVTCQVIFEFFSKNYCILGDYMIECFCRLIS